MGLYKTTAIVLHSAPYREADALLSLYAPAYGKIRALAKGVRKPKSRLRGGVQPLTKGFFVLYAGKSLDTVTQCALEAAFPRLHADLERWAQANYLAELVLALVPEKEGSTQLFALLLAAFNLLEEGEQPAAVARFFELRLLALLGYCPQLGSCGACGRPLPEAAPWPLGQEGLLCGSCAAARRQTRQIGRRARSALEFFLRAKPAALKHLRLDAGILAELETALAFWLGHYLERPLKSAAILKELNV